MPTNTPGHPRSFNPEGEEQRGFGWAPIAAVLSMWAGCAAVISGHLSLAAPCAAGFVLCVLVGVLVDEAQAL